MNALIDLIQIIKRGFSQHDIQFLERQSEYARNSQAYKNVKILHNIPFNAENLLKLEPLYLGGADLSVTCPSFMQADKAFGCL